MIARTLLVLVFTLGFSFGCGGAMMLPSARPFYQSEAHPSVGRQGMIAAARRFLTTNGWTNLRQRTGGFRLSAVQPIEPGMRESIVLEVKEQGELMVWVRTQLSDDDGRWISPSTTCDSYSFARERDIVARIVDGLDN